MIITYSEVKGFPVLLEIWINGRPSVLETCTCPINKVYVCDILCLMIRLASPVGRVQMPAAYIHAEGLFTSFNAMRLRKSGATWNPFAETLSSIIAGN